MHQKNSGQGLLHQASQRLLRNIGAILPSKRQPSQSLWTTRLVGPDRRRNKVMADSGTTKMQKAFFKAMCVPYNGTTT